MTSWFLLLAQGAADGKESGIPWSVAAGGGAALTSAISFLFYIFYQGYQQLQKKVDDQFAQTTEHLHKCEESHDAVQAELATMKGRDSVVKDLKAMIQELLVEVGRNKGA